MGLEGLACWRSYGFRGSDAMSCLYLLSGRDRMINVCNERPERKMPKKPLATGIYSSRVTLIAVVQPLDISCGRLS